MSSTPRNTGAVEPVTRMVLAYASSYAFCIRKPAQQQHTCYIERKSDGNPCIPCLMRAQVGAFAIIALGYSCQVKQFQRSAHAPKDAVARVAFLRLAQHYRLPVGAGQCRQVPAGLELFGVSAGAPHEEFVKVLNLRRRWCNQLSCHGDSFIKQETFFKATLRAQGLR